jgi:hypothetical protein
VSAVWLTGSVTVSPGPEEGAFLLFVKPAEEILKSRIEAARSDSLSYSSWARNSSDDNTGSSLAE